MMNRRDFLAATVVAAASADAAPQLALNGGVPVRTKPLVNSAPGSSLVFEPRESGSVMRRR